MRKNEKHRIEIIQHRRMWRGGGATENVEVEWLRVTGSQVKPDRLQGLVNDCYHVKHPVKL